MRQKLPVFLQRFAGASLCVLLTLSASSCVKLPRRVFLSKQQALSAPQADARIININTASGAELERLPGVGAMLAARILAHRERHGRFRRAEHLLMVSGISDRRFRQLRPFITAE